MNPYLVNAHSVLGLPAVWAAIRFLADNLASFPREVVQHHAPAKPGEDREHPAESILDRPNGYQNPFVFWRTLFSGAAQTGNGYAMIRRGRARDTLHNLLPDDVMPFRWTPEGTDEPETWYWHKPTKAAIPAADVIHLMVLSHDGLIGIDPTWQHQATLERAGTLDRYLTRYLVSGSMVRGSVEVPGALTDDQVAEFRQVLRGFQGPEGEEDLLILTRGAKMGPGAASAKDSELMAQASHSTKQIAQIYGVPPQFLYELSEGKYNNLVDQGHEVVRYTFRPWIIQAESELTRKLLTPRDQAEGWRVQLDPDALLRGDFKTQTETIINRKNAGLVTTNESRKELGYSPVNDPSADQLQAPLGSTGKPATPAGGTPAATPPVA